MITESTFINRTSNYEELNDIQRRLLYHINENQGIRYRELLRLADLSNGVLTYHLTLLEKSDQIKVERNIQRRTTRYYTNGISAEETGVIGYTRHGATRQIILFILEHDPCSFNDIVEYTKKAPSTISWHLKRLKEAGIISVQYGQYQLYKVTNKEAVTEVLDKYKQRFIDRIVDNYTEAMEEL
jgi:predicted transcriptional regulator